VKLPSRLAILLSGRGSNFLAIARAIREGRLPDAEIAIVIANVADAMGLVMAREMGISTALFVSKGRTRSDHDRDIIACLRQHQVDLVCLAGYMRLLSPEFIAEFPNRILNIHPSLLPAFPGANAYRQAYERGVKVVGVTAHFVTPNLDEGPIIAQEVLKVRSNEPLASIVKRGQTLETKCVLHAVRTYVTKRLDVHWGRVYS